MPNGGYPRVTAGAGVSVRPTRGDRCCATDASSRRSDSMSAWRAVAERRFRVRVDVDDDAVGADRDGRPRQRQHEVAAAARVRRVDDHRQVREPLR